MLVLEDMHWADEGTLDVLRLLGRRMEGVPALAVATFRDDEPGPLRVVLGELATAIGVVRLELPPLSAEAVRTLAEPHGVDADALHRSTGGNPFYVTEVLSAPAAAIPATVRDAVLARAARLSPPARELLERLAMIPGSAEPELIDAADEPLDECLLSGMTRLEGRAVAFRHELARLAVEAEVPPRRRAALHREVLDRLDARGADPARLAHHAEAAGDAAAVLRHAPVAGEQAARLGAHREAAAQYARALRWAGDLPAGERGGAARAPLVRVLPDRPDGRGGPGARAGARLPPRAGRRHRRGRRPPLALAAALVPRAECGGRALRGRGGRAARAAAGGAGAGDGVLQPRSALRCSQRTPRGRSTGAGGRSRSPSRSARTRSSSTRSTTSARRRTRTSGPRAAQRSSTASRWQRPRATRSTWRAPTAT